ncbi:hypothetical protein GCM10027180_38780 [Microbulbifer echini]
MVTAYVGNYEELLLATPSLEIVHKVTLNRNVLQIIVTPLWSEVEIFCECL